MRVFATCEYDGGPYSGWQRQNNAPTVQEEIEKALEQLTGCCIPITGAGRTDAGVHALGQVFHFDIDTAIPVERLAYALNFILPLQIRITSTVEAAADASARFDALGKHYRYTVFNRQISSPLAAGHAWHIPYAQLDEERMRRSMACLKGEHDFAAFMATGSQNKTTVRCIHDIRLKREGNFYTIDVWGNGFLYNMVRIIAGTLVDIGRGKCSEDTFSRMLATLDREEGGTTAPAHGLCMVEVFYPDRVYADKG